MAGGAPVSLTNALTGYQARAHLSSLSPSLYPPLPHQQSLSLGENIQGYLVLLSLEFITGTNFCFHSNFSWSASSTGQPWHSRTSSWPSKITLNCVWRNAGPHPRSEAVMPLAGGWVGGSQRREENSKIGSGGLSEG